MGNSNKRPTAEIINPGLGDIEKVRDILFGKYVTGFEHRFAELESRLEADVDQLKARLAEKAAGMDKVLSRSIERLNQQINSEQSERDQGMSALQETLAKAETNLQHSINLMEDQTVQDLASLKEALKTSQQELLDQVSSVQKELLTRVENEKQELENDKVGRQSLALMLDEVAVRLRSNE
jgi:hypothetical protein